MTDRLSDSNFDFIDQNSPPGSLPSESSKLRVAGGCTEWIPYHNPSSAVGDLTKQHAAANMTTLSEGLFWDISNIALAQGRLQRKILLNNKQEVWRDMYVMLEKDRIWMFSQNMAARTSLGIAPDREHLPPTYIPLPCESKSQSRLIAQIVDSNVFSITVSYGLPPNNGSTPSSVSTAVTLNELTTTLTFRTRSMDIAEYWVKTIYRINERIRLTNQKTVGSRSNNGLSALMPSAPPSSSSKQSKQQQQQGQARNSDEDLFTDNDIIANIEASISASQSLISDEEIKLAGRLSTFEGMMQCSYLRGYFQKYLMTESLEETLLFWEYAEDFRRGHPQTQSPFAFALADHCRIDSADGVRQWAESIYLSFVEAYAFLQVSQCDNADMDRIGDLIKGTVGRSDGDDAASTETETDEQRLDRLRDVMLPYDLFDPIQRAAFRTMKYNFYPEFTKQPNYIKLLKAALHASQRAQKRLNLFSSFLKSDVEHPTARGIIQQPPSEIHPIPSKTETSSVRFPVFNFMTRSRNNAANTDKNSKGSGGDASKAGGGPPAVVMVTPWRKRMSSARSEKQSAEQRLSNSKTWGVNRMMATSAIAKRNKVTWMPEWWWDYIQLACSSLDEEAAVRSVWVAEELRMSAEAAAKAKKHKSDARRQKRLEEEALGKQLSEKTENEAEESDSDAESVIINTNGNPALYALAQEGFDSDHSFDGGSNSRPGAALAGAVGGGAGAGKRRSVMEETSGEDLYRCPSWMPQNIDDVREELEQRLQEYNKLMSQRSDVSNDIHRDLLLKLQNRDGPAVESTRLSDGGTSHPYTNSGGNGVYRSHPVHNTAVAAETSVAVGSTESRAELKKTLLSTNYQQYQPHSYLANPGIPAVGTVLLSASVRCRYYKRKKPRPPPPVTSSGALGISNTSSFAPPAGMSFSIRNHPSVKVNTAGNFNNASQVEASVNNANYAALKDALDSGGNPSESSNSPSHANQQVSASSAAAMAAGRRARSPSDEFLGQGIAGVEWVKQFALITIFLGEARICLYDPLTLLQTCSIQLSSVWKIAPTVNQLHSIDVIDCYGLNWQLIPEGVDEDDNRNITKRWLELISVITLPTTDITYIVKSGYLNKRGRYNKAFKQRWFVLTSDYKLRYYKDDSPSSQYKGEIVFEPSTTAYDVIRFNKEIVMNMRKIDRTFILMAEDAKISEEWVQLIYQLLLVRDSTPQNPSINFGSTHTSATNSMKLPTGSIPEGDEGDDDDDED